MVKDQADLSVRAVPPCSCPELDEAAKDCKEWRCPTCEEVWLLLPGRLADKVPVAAVR